MVRVYGRKGCSKCDAAKEKLPLLGFQEGISWEFVDLMEPSDGWRENGAVEAMAAYADLDDLPLFILGDGSPVLTYPQAMGVLRKGKGGDQ